jgi:hypothetical protein
MSHSEKARRNFQPVPTFSVGISLSEWLGGRHILIDYFVDARSVV